MEDHEEFRPFHETYKIITFVLRIGMIYPNPKTVMHRILSIVLLIISSTPVVVAILIDMYRCFIMRDWVNLIRHSTIAGPFLAGLLKMLLMNFEHVKTKQILDEMDRDFLRFNDFKDEYRCIVADSIKNSQTYSEKAWTITVIVCVMIFPAVAIVQNIYNFTFKSEPTKYMIHDLNKPFSEPEERFESPYFEIMFVYMFFCALVYVVNFIGYDGLFGLAINHACLKMELLCAALDDAMNQTENIEAKVIEVIKEQCRMYEFVQWIQDTFNIWLGIIFIATMVHIGTSLYHFTEGYGFDLRYAVFLIGATVHIYLPCRYAGKLKTKALEVAIRIYCCGWENKDNQNVKQKIAFMIARSQMPLEISALNMIVFDMELFLSIMQTSYSMFTLLTSQNT